MDSPECRATTGSAVKARLLLPAGPHKTTQEMTKGYRTFVKLDDYELAALRKLKKELAARNRKKGRRAPTMADLIRGCIRTAIHTVYGDDYVYQGLLTEEEFKSQLEKIDPSLLELEAED
jgi:hypothetical protein